MRLADTAPSCTGFGVDFGCWDDPHPAAKVLVDNQRTVWDRYHQTHEVHIRDINKGFDDWPDARFDFVYSSHLLEHLIDPHAFLRTCLRILKPGGNLVLLLPDEDFYWPNGHPHANPDHKWWHLSPAKVERWLYAAGPIKPHPWVSSATAPEAGKWGFVIVATRE